MKELCLLLGAMVRVLPISASQSSGRQLSGLLDMKQLQSIGDFFIHLFKNVKHNGATDKAHCGFVAVTERLLQQPQVRCTTQAIAIRTRALCV